MTGWNDAINDLAPGQNAPTAISVPASTPPPDPFDKSISDLSSSGPIVTNPGAPANEDVTREMAGAGYEMARGLTGNLVNKIAPQSVQTAAQQYESAHPYGAAIDRFTGALIPGMIAPESIPLGGFDAAATLPRAMTANAILGGAFGGMSGYGESSDHPVRDALMGAAAGTALGAAAPIGAEFIAKPAFEGLSASLSGTAPDRLAMSRIRQRILQGQQAGGPSFDDMRAAIQAQPDKPLGLVDVGPDTIRGLAGQVARTPGAAGQTASTFFNNRDVTAMGRVLDDIDSHVSSGQDVYTAMQAIDAQKAAESKPLYDQFRAFRPVSPDTIAPGGELNDLMQTPAMKTAARNALTIAANRRVDPNTLGITFNEAGDPVFQQVPSWQTLQYMKQGLDDVVNSNRNPVTGKINWDNQSRSVNNVLQDFQKFLSDNNPYWEPANKVWSGHAATQNAMEWGQDFKSFTPAQIQDRLSQMNPAEKQAALVGLADTLRKDVMKTRASADEAGKILPQGDQQQGWQYQQLAPFFQDQGTFNNWVNRVLTESKMAQTKSQIIGGSQTMARAREDEEGGSGAGAHVAQLATGLAALHAGEPFASVPMIYRGSRGIIGALRAPNKRVAESMSHILFNPNPGENLKNLNMLSVAPSNPIYPKLIPGIAEAAGAIPAGILGNRIGENQP
jgi:hypothetical protein